MKDSTSIFLGVVILVVFFGVFSFQFSGGGDFAGLDELGESGNYSPNETTVGGTSVGKYGKTDKTTPSTETNVRGTEVRKDSDNDGLYNAEEEKLGTNPEKADTDGDGLNDSSEVNVYDTNPLSTDTDGDGVSDYDEVKEYNTNPKKADTDGDGLSDGSEVNEYDSDPTSQDTDGDGLLDGEEARIGTSLTDTDTDGDGLSDKEEVEGKTSPLKRDTDGDKLSDSAEKIIGTDPLDKDTDGDGFWDGVEASDIEIIGEEGDPLKKDVYVKMDRTENVGELDQESINKLITAFENAPVQNPNGTGINLHLYSGKDVINAPDSMSLQEYYEDYYDSEEVYGVKTMGFYHVLLVDEIEGQNENTVGLTAPQITGMLVERRSNSGLTGSTIMHELGHNLGLYPDEYSGIDSTIKDWEEYPSVMNYNRPRNSKHIYTFSSGEGFDDWGEIVDSLPQEKPSSESLRNSIPLVTRDDVK
jgi:hypothetical protein